MAVKERKQITGTTAQINAYAGHEGQIVWDKEKKTFVGMSGTAGNNYPLAPKEYVNNEVAKVNTKLQETNTEVAKKQPKGDYATNAQVTEGLAGKEDKGTCLPLAGGTMVGGIRYSIEGGEFDIRNGDGHGARLALNSANRESYNGMFIMQADDGTNTSALIIHPNGELRLNSRYVDNIVQQTNDAVRYASGLQIEWFSAPITINKNNVHNWSLTFPLPFVEEKPKSVSITSRGGWAYSTTVNLEGTYSTYCAGTLRRTDGDDTSILIIYGIAIGYWR